MSDNLPLPLVSTSADLTDFKFMPLEVARLRRSKAWLICKRQPELAFYMINLWTAAWHSVPAGSLEDDDDVLADAAMCDPHKWGKLRDKIMRGWVKCSNGLLYHPVVAEKVAESWHERLEYSWRKECDRIRKDNKLRAERNEIPLELPTKPERIPAERSGIPAEIALKGEVKGQGKGEVKGNKKEETLPQTPVNKPAIAPTAGPGSGEVSGSDEFDLNHHDPSDPHAALRIPEKLAEDAGAVAAMSLVNEFIRLRKRHWPNECAYPQSTITMIERARPLMADDFPVEVFSEILAQQMAKKVKEGQANAVKSLDFCMLSLQGARVKYIEAVTAGRTPIIPGAAPAEPEVARPYEDHATTQWRSRLEGFRDYGAWSQNHGPKPPGLGQPSPRHAEYPEWLAVEVGVSGPAADEAGKSA